MQKLGKILATLALCVGLAFAALSSTACSDDDNGTGGTGGGTGGTGGMDSGATGGTGGGDASTGG